MIGDFVIKCRKMPKGENNVLKRYLLLSIVAVVIVSTFSYGTKTFAAFTDIGVTHRAKDEINYLATGLITRGESDNTFRPERQVTRAEAAAMIGRALQYNGAKRVTQFSDVGADNFASGYIQQAVENNILTGYSNDIFKPNQPVARGEMAIMIGRAFGYNPRTITIASEQLISMGIAQGLPDGTFGTANYIKRSDFAVFLSRSINPQMRMLGNEPDFNQTAYVTTNDLNVRTGPGTTYPVTGQLNLGNLVQKAFEIGEWAYISYNNQQGFIHTAYLSTSKPDVTSVLSQKTIIIDPGHGYPDPGAVAYGLLESDVVLDTSLRLKEYFKKTPINIKLTREIDKKVELSDRVKFAVENKGDIFISVHANSFNGSANGTETFYYSASATNPNVAQSKALSIYLQNRLLGALELRDRGVKKGNYHVLRENKMPSSLVELGFIDYKEDNAKLASPTWREKAARGLYLGILDYYYHYEGLQEVKPLYNEVGGKPSAKLH